MTVKEREQMKARLIETGLWSQDLEGDPTVDEEAARALERQAGKKFGVRFIGFSAASAGTLPSSFNSIAVYRRDEVVLRVTGSTYAEAICFAALALSTLPSED